MTTATLTPNMGHMLEQDSDTIILGTLPIGTRCRIVRIDGGPDMIRRLISLGVRIGMELEILQRRGRSVVVGNGSARVALGSSVADKVRAEIV